MLAVRVSRRQAVQITSLADFIRLTTSGATTSGAADHRRIPRRRTVRTAVQVGEQDHAQPYRCQLLLRAVQPQLGVDGPEVPP